MAAEWDENKNPYVILELEKGADSTDEDIRKVCCPRLSLSFTAWPHLLPDPLTLSQSHNMAPWLAYPADKLLVYQPDKLLTGEAQPWSLIA